MKIGKLTKRRFVELIDMILVKMSRQVELTVVGGKHFKLVADIKVKMKKIDAG